MFYKQPIYPDITITSLNLPDELYLWLALKQLKLLGLWTKWCILFLQLLATTRASFVLLNLNLNYRKEVLKKCGYFLQEDWRFSIHQGTRSTIWRHLHLIMKNTKKSIETILRYRYALLLWEQENAVNKETYFQIPRKIIRNQYYGTIIFTI